MSKRIEEISSFFGIHCYLPAGMIRDLFDEIDRLQGQVDQLAAELGKKLHE